MNDERTTIAQLKLLTGDFVKEREWLQFHNPKNMAMAIAVEAAELMEHFIWVDAAASVQALEQSRTDIEHEIADIAGALIMFCHENGIDLSSAIERKMKLNASKYPIDQVKGIDPLVLKKFKEQLKKK